MTNEKRDPFLAWPEGVRAELVEEILKRADLLADEGSIEESAATWHVARYIETGEWDSP